LPLAAPGLHATGALVGLAFGQMQSTTLKYIAERADGLRLTPWRMMLLEGLREMPAHDAIVTRAHDPLMRVAACTGAPACRSAYDETRTLAAALVPHLPAEAHLHVSGCAKGCAHPASASVTLVATADGFDLVRHGATRDVPALRGVSRTDILADPRGVLGTR
jgi:precorrin-3B synthase